jgi:hypothetical protein
MSAFAEARPVAPARHAQVVPSCFAAHLREPLSCRIGEVQVRELFCWQRSRDLSEADRTILRREVLKRSRGRAQALWAAPIGVRLEEGWAERVSPVERSRLCELLASITPRSFEALTLRELKTFWGRPLEVVLELLARLESLYWVPITAPSTVPVVVPPDPNIPVTAELRALAGQALALAWTANIRADDARFWYPGTVTFKEWVETELRKPRVAPRLPQLLEALVQADRMTAAEEAQAIADAVVRGHYSQQRDEDTYARRTAMFLTRYLSPEGPGRTLQEAGKLFGVTRERIRQLCFVFESAVEDGPPAAPALERVVRTATRLVPCGFSEANEQLRPYLGEGAGIESILVWAQALGRKDLPIRTGSAVYRNRGHVSYARVLEAADGKSTLHDTLRLATRDCAVFGCTNIVRLAGLVALETGVSMDGQALEAAVCEASGFRWLDRETGWFTLGDTEHCAAANRLRKILAVAHDPVGADEVAAALAADDFLLNRSERPKPGIAVPPSQVLRELFRGWPWVHFRQIRRLSAASPIALDSVLAPVELAGLRAIEANGGVACRFEITSRVLALGATPIAVNAMLVCSPIIVKLEFGLYGLRGRRIGPGALDDARIRLHRKLGEQLEAMRSSRSFSRASRPLPCGTNSSRFRECSETCCSDASIPCSMSRAPRWAVRVSPIPAQ